VDHCHKSWGSRLLLLALASSGLAVSAHDLPSTLDSQVSGWVLSDLNGDQSVDLATARSGRHDSNGYAQEVSVKLGAYQQTSFRFLSPGAIVELSSQDVDGDADGDLVVFEPLSSQPIGVWLNDGRGTFHEARLTDFRTIKSERSRPALFARFQQLPLFAISEERLQILMPSAAVTALEPILTGCTWQDESSLPVTRSTDHSPRGPPRNF
jgi:hypothetical protein